MVKTSRGRRKKQRKKDEVYGYSVQAADGRLVGCLMSKISAEEYAQAHGGKRVRVKLVIVRRKS